MIRRALSALRHRFGPSPPPLNLADHPFSVAGRCNICGERTTFLCADKVLYRESLNCGVCLSTSRYRSLARGVLQAVRELTGVEAASLNDLARRHSARRLRIYDTQVPFRVTTCAYPIPECLAAVPWIDLEISIYKSGLAPGTRVDLRTSIQNLEALTFPDGAFDVLLTSDVMEHVRLHGRAHAQIARVVKPGGVYLFTVPHYRHQRETYYRVQVVNPDDPSTDLYLCEKEYHGDQNAEDGMALSYRSYGTDIDEDLNALGFDVEYTKRDMPEVGIMNTELFYCRKRAGDAPI